MEVTDIMVWFQLYRPVNVSWQPLKGRGMVWSECDSSQPDTCASVIATGIAKSLCHFQVAPHGHLDLPVDWMYFPCIIGGLFHSSLMKGRFAMGRLREILKNLYEGTLAGVALIVLSVLVELLATWSGKRVSPFTRMALMAFSNFSLVLGLVMVSFFLLAGVWKVLIGISPTLAKSEEVTRKYFSVKDLWFLLSAGILIALWWFFSLLATYFRVSGNPAGMPIAVLDYLSVIMLILAVVLIIIFAVIVFGKPFGLTSWLKGLFGFRKKSPDDKK